MFLSNLLNDPRAALIGLLLSLPGILLALCAHESAHAYIADRCGDPTARLMGRISLNPLRHIDPIGFACMFLVGFGWAKPVPVNPNNLRHGRRDDLKVSLAGIVTNLILCLLSFLLMMVIVQIAIHKTPSYTGTLAYYRAADVDVAFVTVGGERYLASSLTLDMKELFNAASGLWSYKDASGATFNILDNFINPVLGEAPGYLYQIFFRSACINVALAVFNLIPLPPLDGYHVLNDLMLKRPLFATEKAVRIGGGIMMALILIGNYNADWDIISIAINFVEQHVFIGLSSLARLFSAAVHLI